jgi:hypothetical protein
MFFGDKAERVCCCEQVVDVAEAREAEKPIYLQVDKSRICFPPSPSIYQLLLNEFTWLRRLVVENSGNSATSQE